MCPIDKEADVVPDARAIPEGLHTILRLFAAAAFGG
jgi:hypothetical protein